MIFSRKIMLAAALLAAALCAVYGLMPRLNAEKNDKIVGFVSEYKDVLTLSMQSGESQAAVMDRMAPNGVVGLMVHEYTGDELTLSQTMPLSYGVASSFGVTGEDSVRAAISIPADSKYLDPIYEYLNIKIPNVKRAEIGGNVVILLPGNMEDFRLASLMPDFRGLDFCREEGIIAIFRPSPSPTADGTRTAAAIDWLAKRYPEIKCIVPAGLMMAGYPDIKPIRDVLIKHKMVVANVEFVRQTGVARFISMMAPNVVSMHSLTRDEIVARRMSRIQIVERMVRAVQERSVRLIIMRPYELQMGGRFESFASDLGRVKSAIEAKGYSFGWPEHLPSWPVSKMGALACGIAFIFLAWSFALRFAGVEDGQADIKEAAILIALSLLLAGALLKVSLAARLLGGFLGGLAATEASLAALERYKKPIRGLVAGLFVVLACGVAIASFYGTTKAAMRLTPFSGVKLTLLLPPLLILVHDLRRKIHHESAADIASRPAVWGELALVGFMMLAIMIMALRSDNVANVPALEVAFRNFIERALVVRPRTKEFVIGYPALILYYCIMRKGWAPHYREALRVAATMAFASAINTFCHFHTSLVLSAVRVLNGWWLGIIVGFAASIALLYIAVPLWNKGAKELFR
jgi:hypothetical protein